MKTRRGPQQESRVLMDVDIGVVWLQAKNSKDGHRQQELGERHRTDSASKTSEGDN